MEISAIEPADYGDWRGEYAALRESAALADLSGRGRLCLVGADARNFLHGQVTNNVKDLKVGQGCYAALVSAKGKMQSDLYIYRLENELLLDFEPGLSAVVKERLEKYVIAEDVQIIDAAPLYGHLRVQGPKAELLLWKSRLPTEPLQINSVAQEGGAEIYVALHPGPPSMAYDIFAPTGILESLAGELFDAVKTRCGWRALETVRIESTVPRFGADLDESNLPPEAGLESRAISYSKGCYIGQEVIARIRTYGQVAKTLRGLKLAPGAKLPPRDAKLFLGDKEVGRVTSAAESPRCQTNIALGYVRKEANAIGTELLVEIDGEKSPAVIATVPFQPF